MRNLAKLSLLAVLAASPAAAQSINLLCTGSGGANKDDDQQVTAFDSKGNAVHATQTGTRTVNFSDEVAVDIDGGSGRMRVPRILLPAIHSGGKDGWYNLDHLVIAEKEITGSLKLGPLNNPKFRIDRISGNLSINGKVGDFNGACKPYDPNKVERKF